MVVLLKILELRCLFGANEVELGKQWANNKLLTSLQKIMKLLDVLRRGINITVLFKQRSKEIEGEFLGRLVLGVEGEEVKVFGAHLLIIILKNFLLNNYLTNIKSVLFRI